MHWDEHVYRGTEHKTTIIPYDSFMFAIIRRLYKMILLYLRLYIHIWSISNLSSVVQDEIRIVRKVLRHRGSRSSRTECCPQTTCCVKSYYCTTHGRDTIWKRKTTLQEGKNQRGARSTGEIITHLIIIDRRLVATGRTQRADIARTWLLVH